MHESISAAAKLLKFDNDLFLNKIANLEEKTANARINDNVSPVRWIAGHMTSTRAHVLQLLGGKFDVPWGSKFQDKYDPSVDYPGMSELRGAWTEISAQLFSRLEQAGPDILEEKLDYELPHGENTVAGAVVFFTYHEAWHLGQISLIRKSHDMEGVVPY